MSVKPSPAKATTGAAAKTPAKSAAKSPAAKPAPASAAKAPPKAAAKPAPAPAPSSAPAHEEPAATSAADASGAEGKKSRVQLAMVLEISISQARCATHLKQSLGDEAIEAQIKELREELKAAKDAKDLTPAAKSAKVDGLKKKIADLSKSIVRMSSETPIATATVMDNMAKELLMFGMDMAIASDRKIVEVSHLHEGNPENLVYYPIFSKLPTYAGFNPENEEELRKKRAAENKAAKEAREAKKAAEEKKAGAARAARPPAKAARADAEEDDDEEGAEHTKTTFFTYVENAIKIVKQNEPYRTMRVSNRMRECLSDIIAEAINRLACLARILVTRVMGVRTMNADHVKAVVHMLIADAGRPADQIDEVEAQINAKLALYHEHLKAERAKKFSHLDAEKKAELERKKVESDIARKKKQAEQAQARSVEAAARAKSLAAETEKLAAAQAAAAPAEDGK